LSAAVKFLPKDAAPVMVITDDGRENVAVEDEGFAGLLTRITAQVDVSFSNSMIESLWNQAKHRWLYLYELDTVDTLRSLFGKFIDDHNALIPRVALGGRTPDEAFLACEQDLPGRLAELRAQARVERVAFNRALTGCGGCDGPAQALQKDEVVDCR
jgi:putative transposase